MQEVLDKTHLIITDIHDEYHIKWCGRILDTKPKLRNGLPVFSISGGKGRTEIETADIKEVERVAKAMTNPVGRSAVTTDVAYIYIKEIGGTEKLLGTLTNKRIKKFAPMYDVVGYKD